MAISLYDVSVLSFIQGLTGVAKFLDMGLTHCKDKGIDPSEFVDTRIHPDMRPLRFQIVSVAHHSIGAIKDVIRGLYAPPAETSTHDYIGLQGIVSDARDALQQLSVDEINALEGKDLVLKALDFEIPFTVEGFLMSISIPNFHFHATTAYNILRLKGVEIGKLDYTGPMRTKS